MEIGGLGSSGLSYQDLLDMRETGATQDNSSRALSSRSPNSAASSIASDSIKTGASATSQNSQNNSKQQSTPQPLKTQTPNTELVAKQNPNAVLAAALKGNAHQFAIDQVLRQSGNPAAFAQTLPARADTSGANPRTSTNAFLTSPLATPQALSVKSSFATPSIAQVSAVTAKYSPAGQSPVLNTFKPVDKYI